MERSKTASSGNGRFVRRMIDSHSVLGLTFAALIYIVSLTGAIALFEHEISLWENPSAPAAKTTSPQALEMALNTLIDQSGGPEMEQVFPFVEAPGTFKPIMLGRLGQQATSGSDFENRWFALDPSTGEIAQPYQTHLTDFFVYLHTDLHLPRPWGRYLVGLLGVCMFSLILSGIFAHPTILKDAFKLRLTSNTRMAWTDMHNRLSVWGLPFHLVLTFTGAFLGIAGIAIAGIAYVAYEGDTEAAVQAIRGAAVIEAEPLSRPIPVAAMMRQIDQRRGHVESVFVDDPFNEGGVTRFNLRDDTALAFNSSAQFRNTGAFTQYLGGSGAAAGMTAVALVPPLHYGTFGGYGIKGLYVILSLALTYITSTGMMIWFRRRTQQGSPVPRTQAAWHGMTTGLSFALGLVTLVSASGLETSLPLIAFPAWAVVALAIWQGSNTQRLVKAAYNMIGILLIVSFALHLPQTLAADALLQRHLIAIDLVILALGLAHVWLGARRDKLVKERVDRAAVPAE
jgi:uncharacterized iron-regulated membrane protein